MKNLLRIEFKKAIKNKLFFFSVAIGCIFSLMSGIYMLELYYSDLGVGGFLRTMDDSTIKYIAFESATLYNYWIGGETLSLGFRLFFSLLPILAMIPCGLSISEEMHSGYLKVVIPKCGRKNYFLAKIIATFTVGGLAIIIPLIFSLLFIAMFVPAIKPNVIYNMYIPIQHGNMFSQLFYTSPILFTIAYLILDFVFAGLFACMSITTAFFSRHRAASIIIPFLAITACDMLRSFLFYISYIEISPLKLMHAVIEQNYAKLPVIAAWLMLFFLITYPIIMIRGCKLEIL